MSIDGRVNYFELMSVFVQITVHTNFVTGKVTPVFIMIIENAHTLNNRKTSLVSGFHESKTFVQKGKEAIYSLKNVCPRLC